MGNSVIYPPEADIWEEVIQSLNKGLTNFGCQTTICWEFSECVAVLFHYSHQNMYHVFLFYVLYLI